jgi:pimeloyl-ACP methyl ester carboxylesterase
VRTLMMVRASRPQENEAMQREAADMLHDDGRLHAARPLGRLPLVVLAADSSVDQSQAWQASQERQAALSTNSWLIVVPYSSHYLALDQPTAVAEAVRFVLTTPDRPVSTGWPRPYN